MKNLLKISLIALCVLTLSQAANAQNFYYDFNYFEAPYVELTGGTSYSEAGFGVEELTPYAPIEFVFDLYGFPLTELAFDYYGEMGYNDHVTEGSDTYTAQLIPFAAFYDWGTNSTISHKIEGTPGNRIFKAQWKEFKLDNDEVGDNIMNLQLWLYESDRAIEFRSGNMKIDQSDCYWTDTEGGFSCLMLINNDTGNAYENVVCLTDSAQHPQMEIFYEQQPNNNTLGCMPSNFVYRFAPKNAGIKVQNLNFSFYPNPATENLTIVPFNQKSTISYAISDLSGKTILAGTGLSPDVSTLAKGSYLLTISDQNTQSTQPLLKD